MKHISYLFLCSMMMGHVAVIHAPAEEPMENLKSVLSDHVQERMKLEERQAEQRKDLQDRIEDYGYEQRRIDRGQSTGEGLGKSASSVAQFHNRLVSEGSISGKTMSPNDVLEDPYRVTAEVNRNLDELHQKQRDALKAAQDKSWGDAKGKYIISVKNPDMETLRQLNHEHEAPLAVEPTPEEVAKQKQQALEAEAASSFVPEAVPTPVVAKPIEKLSKVEKNAFRVLLDTISDWFESGDVADARRAIKSGLVRRDVGKITMESKAEDVVQTGKLKIALEKLTPEQRIDVLNEYFNPEFILSNVDRIDLTKADGFKVLEAVNKMLPEDEQVSLIYDRSTGEKFVRRKKQ